MLMFWRSGEEKPYTQKYHQKGQNDRLQCANSFSLNDGSYQERKPVEKVSHCQNNGGQEDEVVQNQNEIDITYTAAPLPPNALLKPILATCSSTGSSLVAITMTAG